MTVRKTYQESQLDSLQSRLHTKQKEIAALLSQNEQLVKEIHELKLQLKLKENL